MYTCVYVALSLSASSNLQAFFPLVCCRFSVLFPFTMSFAPPSPSSPARPWPPAFASRHSPKQFGSPLLKIGVVELLSLCPRDFHLQLLILPSRRARNKRFSFGFGGSISPSQSELTLISPLSSSFPPVLLFPHPLPLLAVASWSNFSPCGFMFQRPVPRQLSPPKFAVVPAFVSCSATARPRHQFSSLVPALPSFSELT